MTISELLEYLDANTQFSVLDGEVQQTLDKARAGTHSDPIMGEIVKGIADGCGCDSPDSTLERVDAVNALGPVRLKYMADDAPVEGFRAVEGTIHAIDGAFNEEALRQKGG